MSLYHREDHYDEAAIAGMATHYRALIEAIGEDADREGLVKTPNGRPRRWPSSRRGRGQTPPTFCAAHCLRRTVRKWC